MPEYKTTFSGLVIRREDLYRELGYGETIPQSDVMEIIDLVWKRAEEIAMPRLCYEILAGEKLDKTHIRIGDTELFCGSIIAGYLDGVERFVVFVTTAGAEYEAYLHDLKASGDVVTEYIADALGSVIAEAAVTGIGRQVEQAIMYTGETASYPYSPGYCGWHIREQAQLFSLLPDTPCGVRLTESSLMVPIKSVSGIFGLGVGIHRQGYACDICGLKTCYKRNQKRN